MSLHLETQAAFQSLGLADVPEEWVSEVWEQNFSEGVTLPFQVEDRVLSGENWGRALKACQQWAQMDREEEEEEGPPVGIWTALLDGDMSHKALMALSYCLLERNKERHLDRVCAVFAGQLYLTLLQIPGSSAFKIFHPMIFQKALDVLCLFPDKEAHVLHQRRGSAQPAVRLGRGRGRRGKRKRQQVEEEEWGEEGMETSAHGEGEGEEGREEIRLLLKQLIRTVLQLLSSLSLSEYEASRYQLIQVMLQMTHSEVDSHSIPLPLGQPGPCGTDVPMCVLAWKCLEALCQPLHGSVEKTASEVFRHLLPSLLMLTRDGGVCTASSLPHSLITNSHHTLSFLCFLSEKHGDSVVGPLKALVQHLCTRVPDRAEYRSRLSTAVTKLLSLFSDELYSQMLEWIYKFSRNTKIAYRVFALDIVGELLLQPLRQPKPGELSGESEYRLTHRFLLKMVLSRCSDKAPSVRGRALSCLVAGASCGDEAVVEAVSNSVFSQTTSDPLLSTPHAGSANESVIVSMVRRRASDEKVGVRKAALQALEAIIRLDLANIKKEDVAVIHERCLDPALSVRKQALTSLTALIVDRPQCDILHRLWLDGVLPMVMDRESGAQDKCMALLQEVLLDNITPLNMSTGEPHQLVWALLAEVSAEDNLDLRRYLRRALEAWSRQGRLQPSLVRAVCSHTAIEAHLQFPQEVWDLKPSEYYMAAWMLLAEVSQFTNAIETKFLLDSWHQYSSSISMPTHSPLVQILVVIGNMASSLGKAAMEDVKDHVVSLLSSFKLPPGVVQAAVNTLCQICAALNTPGNHQSSLDSWCVPLLKSCEQYLSSVLLKPDSGSPVDVSESEATCYLFTLGEVAQLCPVHTSHHLCRMVQSMLLATSEQANESSCSSSHSSQLSGLSRLSLSPTLRAHAYITLGKLCLQNEELAKKSILQMVRELEHSTIPAIRNNIIIVLCDLAVRYSAKVDPYIPNVAACLRDESLLVRKQTLTLIARLLQEDYVKWKGSLFFRFVSTLVDEELKKFAEYCLVHLLLSRQPAVFFHHFTECIFHFNGYQKHRVYNRFKQSDRERQLFSLAGMRHSEKRIAIYTFLLSHMADEHRFQLTAKLCQEVLGGLVDGVIPLDDDSAPLVRDTLAVLTSREIKLSSLRRNVGEELAEEGDHVGAAVASAQTKIISQIVKKNVIENIIPIVISVKHLFERERSPLLKDLLSYLKQLMHDYRDEVSDILAADCQLAEEIKFDLKRFEEEQKKIAKAQTPLTVTPHAQMISPLLSPGALGSPAVGGSVFTPPRLRREGGGNTPARRTPLGHARKMKTPAALRLGMSPLVVVQRVQQRKTPAPSTFLTTPGPRTKQEAPPPQEATPTQQREREDVSSPAAAKRRVAMVTSEYATSITTPVIPAKTPRIPLQRAVLLSTARKTAALHTATTPHPQQRMPPSRYPSDETMLIGRAASTPEGLAESISFNVSSLVPPSPIPTNTTVESYATRKTRSRTRKEKQQLETADILMISPQAEPRKLEKWKVHVKK